MRSERSWRVQRLVQVGEGLLLGLVVVGVLFLWAVTLRAQAPLTTASAARATAKRDPVRVAAREFAETGVARPVVRGTAMVFPFGHVQPVVTCAALRACVIELEDGETVLSKATGDAERWVVGAARMGPGGRTPLVVVKPKACDATTNLVLATDRRIYDVTLDAAPCRPTSTNPANPYVRHIRFWFPDQLVEPWQPAAAPPAAPRRPAPRPVALHELSVNYRVKKDGKFPWKPRAVYDNGRQVVIQVPEEARQGELPTLYVIEDDGSRSVLNYTVQGNAYVTDRTFDRAELVTKSGSKERRVKIERRKDDDD